MDTCSHCDGFLPASGDTCPNCGTRTATKALAHAGRAAAAAAMVVTLSACYGLGMERYDELPRTPAAACGYAAMDLDASGYGEGDTGDGSNALEGSCVGKNSPEQVVWYHPDAEHRGAAGVLAITWTSPYAEVGVYVREECESGVELACEPVASTGYIELEVDALTDMSIIVDSNQPANASFELQVVFEPAQ